MFARMIVKVHLIRARTRISQIVIKIRFCPTKREAPAIVDRSIDKAQCEQGSRSIGDALPNIELLADIAQEQPTISEYMRSFYRLDSTMHRLWDSPLSRVRPSVITMSALAVGFCTIVMTTLRFYREAFQSRSMPKERIKCWSIFYH